MQNMSITQLESDLICGVGSKSLILQELADRANAGIKASKALARMGSGWANDIEKINNTVTRVKEIILRFQ